MKNRQPISANPHAQVAPQNASGWRAACVRAVVVTTALKVDAVVALTEVVAGAVQVAAGGAPVQVSEAVPATPWPPIDSVKVTFEPALKVAELELPVAIPRPRDAFPPVPESDTVCGLPEALSVIVRVPLRLPDALGVKVTVTVQLPLGPITLPQLFVSAKSPVVAMWEI